MCRQPLTVLHQLVLQLMRELGPTLVYFCFSDWGVMITDDKAV